MCAPAAAHRAAPLAVTPRDVLHAAALAADLDAGAGAEEQEEEEEEEEEEAEAEEERWWLRGGEGGAWRGGGVGAGPARR